jgi:hypothetical protein
MLPPLKAIWLASDQLCSELLKAALSEWLGFYEQAHGVLSPEVRQLLLAVSPDQIDRLLKPVRLRHPRNGWPPPGRASCCASTSPRVAARPTPPRPAI